MKDLYTEIKKIISEKENELNNIYKKNKSSIEDMVDEVYLKGELSSLHNVLDMIIKR